MRVFIVFSLCQLIYSIVVNMDYMYPVAAVGSKYSEG